MPKKIRIPVLRIKQWLDEWDEYEFDEAAHRRKPEPHMYVFSMPAEQLRQLSDVYKRQRSVDNVEGIQRVREENRTARIRRYIHFGYPFGDLKENLQVEENLTLRKPGWLPTAIVVNLLTPSDIRRGKKIRRQRMARIVENRGKFSLELPSTSHFSDGDLRPFEVIDGQHRLWAFAEEESEFEGFDLPVVAFAGLDIAWQAYLFWSINISPKRINPSHAFDLYPLLRAQDWLEKTGEITVYREARAQEIVEWLYQFEDSPWYNRINMLGGKGPARVSQAACIRSLLGSFFGTGRGRGRYGLFQAPIDDEGNILSWSRPQQVAFIMQFWYLLQNAVGKGKTNWIGLYKKEKKNAFTDKSSMLNQDMGVRAIHAVINDIFYWESFKWALDDWHFEIEDETNTEPYDIAMAVDSLTEQPFYKQLNDLAIAASSFDWRSLDGPKVRSSKDEMMKRAYRGSGGYTILVEHVLQHIASKGANDVSRTARKILSED